MSKFSADHEQEESNGSNRLDALLRERRTELGCPLRNNPESHGGRIELGCSKGGGRSPEGDGCHRQRYAVSVTRLGTFHLAIHILFFLAFGKLRMMQVVYAVIAHAGKTNPTHLGTTPTTLRDAD